MKLETRKLALSGVLIALGVVLSPYHIPIGAAKCFPWQHLINVISAILLGPVYAVINAIVISTLRNIFAMGTLLAFPGSIFGALFAGLMFKKFANTYLATLGEVIGTGIIGAIIAYPVGILFMGRQAAIFGLVIPFIISSFAGAVIAVLLFELTALKKLVMKKKVSIQ
ncbi:energy coupling factor transporter S component ThiW [Vallitalea guaymasensis]|uniref:energy coupling factor transporter S component ThiW n=1 Tax=Vallitalea guaymasensis TaxID=1185412 RepID=UPI000DE1DD99|nr:energy coupling factor transporter S component ThiW [Vallitalea guaymasensis]